MRFAVLAVLATLSSKVAAGDCAMVEFQPNLLTSAGADIGTKGGLVVAQLPFGQRPTTLSTTWRFQSKQGSVPKITSLAPGLDVYTPPTRSTGKISLYDGDGKALLVVSASAVNKAEPPIPTVGAVKFRENRGRHSSASLIVELVGDPPDGAAALVVYDGKTGKPRSFGTVVKNAKQVLVYSQSDCGGPYKDTIMSKTGDDIRLAWVDASGQLSKQTASIRVRTY